MTRKKAAVEEEKPEEEVEEEQEQQSDTKEGLTETPEFVEETSTRQSSDISALTSVLNRLADGQNSMMVAMKQMNDNLLAGYAATNKTLKDVLTPIAEGYQKQQSPTPVSPAPLDSPNNPGNPGNPGNPNGAGYFDPKAPNPAPQQQGHPMMQTAFSSPEVLSVLINKLLGQDQSQNNMFTMMGQRYFAEMVTSNMLMMRANMRKMAASGTLKPEEVAEYETMQHRLYDPLLGNSGQQIPQPQQQPTGAQPLAK